jgi:hypothetical protein
MRFSFSLLLAAYLAVVPTGFSWAQSTIRSLPLQDQFLDGYFAQINYRDLFNSGGVPISTGTACGTL